VQGCSWFSPAPREQREQKVSTILFNDTTIRSLKAGVYYDTTLKGLGLRVGKTRRSFFFQCGKERLRTPIGVFGAITLAEARTEGYRLKGQTERKIASMPFPEARTAFLAAKKKRMRPRSHQEITRTLTRHFTWTKMLDSITHNDVSVAIEAIEKPSEANHAFKDIRTMFNWCVPRFLKHSPCTGLKMPYKSKARSRVLSDDELKLIWRACSQNSAVEGNSCSADSMRDPTSVSALGQREKAEDRRTLPTNYGTIVKLLMLSGQRRGEIAALRTSFIDADVVTFPETLTKNAYEHFFPLPNLAIEILQTVEVDTTKNDALFFPARGKPDKCFNGWSKAMTALRKALGEDFPHFTIHDLRRTYRTNLGRLKVLPHIGERLLNHVSDRSEVEMIYDRYLYLEEMREAVQKYDTWLRALICTSSVPTVANHGEPQANL